MMEGVHGRRRGVIEYVNREQFAAVLGVTRQRVAQLEREGKLPAVEAYQMIDGEKRRPLWLLATAERFARSRGKGP
jgi:transcriptional regulator with XRE-family HTH domain